MKKLSLTLIGVLFLCSLFAKQIDVRTAQTVAQTFLSGNTTLRSTPSLNLVYTDKDQTLLRSGQAENYYYVFNIGNNNGFIIISADDVNVPVIGYSLQGSYDPTNLPPNFNAWMEGVRMGTKESISKGETPNEKVKSDWENLQAGKLPMRTRATSAAPLLKTAWHQGSPYNNMISLGENGQKCVTGCVATAIAQIMKHHNYPRSGIKATDAYITRTMKYRVPSIDLTKTVYKWGDMLNTYYATNSTTNQRNAVAELVYHCGAALRMDYTISESAAYDFDVLRAMVENFGYDPGIRQINRFATGSDDAWKSILKHEIDNNRPVYYSGQNAAGNSGHAWVCDGYDANGFMSFNWGWGSYSSYYDIDANSYKKDQIAIIEIKPKSTNSSCPMPTGLHANYWYITHNSATLAWNAVSGAQSYSLQYRKGSETTWITAGTVTGTTYNLTGLSPATVYLWQVRANCSSSSSSAYTAFSFTTTPTPSVCAMRYEPNETMATAYPINTNVTYSAGIAKCYDQDYYKFTLTTAQDVVVTLQNLPLDYDLKVYNASGRELGISATKSLDDEIVVLNNLAAGTYYVLVVGYGPARDVTNCYNLRVTATAPLPACVNNYEPNDTRAKAYPIRTNVTYNAGIASATDEDYYRFTLTATQSIEVMLQNLPKNYDLKIYNSSGTQIGSSTNGATSNEKITLNNLISGTYYVCVYGSTSSDYDTKNCYSLQVTPITQSCEIPVGSRATHITDTEAILKWTRQSSATPNNFTLQYKTIDASSWTTVSDTYPTVQYRLTGLKPSTSYIWQVKTNCSSTVTSPYAISTFTTEAAASPCVNNYEPNNTRATAYPININQTYSAGIGSSADEDYYKFTLSETGYIAVTLSNYYKDYRVTVSMESGNTLNGFTTNENGEGAVVFHKLTAGTYVIHIRPLNGNFNLRKCYDLKVTTTPIGSACVNNYEPNETSSDAYPINFNQTYSAGISSSADNDFYKFTLSNTGNVTVTLSNLPYSCSLYIYKDYTYGNPYATDNSAYLDDKNLVLNNLPPATYYIRVVGFGYDLQKCYNLRVSTTTTRSTIDEEPSELNESLSIYPNPVGDILYVKSGSATIKNVTLTNMSGITIRKKAYEGNSADIYMRDLPAGVYIVTVETDQGITTKRIQKQ